jgi:hypothetical protein
MFCEVTILEDHVIHLGIQQRPTADTTLGRHITHFYMKTWIEVATSAQTDIVYCLITAYVVMEIDGLDYTRGLQEVSGRDVRR